MLCTFDISGSVPAYGTLYMVLHCPSHVHKNTEQATDNRQYSINNNIMGDANINNVSSNTNYNRKTHMWQLSAVVPLCGAPLWAAPR